MSVQNANIPVGATVTSTGGTIRNYVVTGKKVNSGVHLIDDDSTTGITAKHAYAVSRDAAVQSNGDFGLGQRSVRFVIPTITLKENVVYNSAEVILRTHPETTEAVRLELLNQVALAIIGTDFVNLFKVGSLA